MEKRRSGAAAWHTEPQVAGKDWWRRPSYRQRGQNSNKRVSSSRTQLLQTFRPDAQPNRKFSDVRLTAHDHWGACSYSDVPVRVRPPLSPGISIQGGLRAALSFLPRIQVIIARRTMLVLARHFNAPFSFFHGRAKSEEVELSERHYHQRSVAAVDVCELRRTARVRRSPPRAARGRPPVPGDPHRVGIGTWTRWTGNRKCNKIAILKLIPDSNHAFGLREKYDVRIQL